MRRCLIVANQTMGGAELEQVVSDQIKDGMTRFHVVVPVTEPGREANWTPHDQAFGVPDPVGAEAKAAQEARRRSRHRLDVMIDKVSSLGGEADGELGDPDPVKAVRQAVKNEQFDHVIVSTLPAGISRWLRMDLPHRVERMVDCPVTTVEAGA